MENVNRIKRYLDKDGKVKELPSKKEIKCLILAYIADKFEYDVNYSEKEVNFIITENHIFNDYFLIRRELIENNFLGRERDCSRYWKIEKENE